jgi:hypothetical protein
MMVRGYVYSTLIVILALFVAACSSSSPTSSSNSNGGTSLGTLPNGSNVIVSSSTFSASSGLSTSGTIGLAGGTSGVSYTLSFAVSPSGPSVTPNPAPCTLVSGSGASCQLNFNAQSAAAGTYTVTVSYSQNSSSGSIRNNSQLKDSSSNALPNTIIFIVTGGGQTIESGVLVIMPLSSESIESGSTESATISLSNSQGITSSNPVIVSISSTNPSILSVSPNSCSLYTASNSCSVTLSGESAGTATLNVNAAGYAESSVSLVISTIAPQLPLLLITPLLESSSIESNGATYALISRSGSLANPVTVSLSSSSSVMSVAESTLVLSSGESAAYVNLLGVSVGSATLSATATGYTESQQSFSITSAPLFSCVADISGSTPTLCGCLNENDGSGLTWYADASQTGAWTAWCTESSTASSYDSNCTGGDGSSLNTFNVVNHCGYTDWHLPTLVATSGAVASAGGQWGTIGTYASANGYSGGGSTGNTFPVFLNTYGFNNVNTGILYWSSVYDGTSNAYGVSMGVGYVHYFSDDDANGVLLVRP